MSFWANKVDPEGFSNVEGVYILTSLVILLSFTFKVTNDESCFQEVLLIM